jgi:hypothetical protein
MSVQPTAETPPTVPFVLRLGKGAAPLFAPALLQPEGPLPQCPSCWSANVAVHSRLAALGYIVFGLIGFLAGFFILLLTYLLGLIIVGDLIWLALIATPMVLYLRERHSARGKWWGDRGIHCFNCGHYWLFSPGASAPRRMGTTMPREVNDRLRDIQRSREEDPSRRQA